MRKYTNENNKLIRKFLKLRGFEIVKTNFSGLSGKIDYIVKEKIFNEKYEFNTKKEEKYKLRFIIVQHLDTLNHNTEFKKKRVPKVYIKKRNVVKNIFTYITIYNIKNEVALDLIQIYNKNNKKKIKYRKNIVNIKNIHNNNLLRDAV